MEKLNKIYHLIVKEINVVHGFLLVLIIYLGWPLVEWVIQEWILKEK